MSNLKIKQVEIDTLIGAEYNPRILKEHQFQQLKNSIQRFGFVEPVIVNINKERANIIISGHQRVNVARALNLKKVPIVEIDLTPEREKELNIRMNKNGGEWDFDILANGDFDLEMLLDAGFQDWELSIGNDEDLDYSILDDEDLDGEIDGMQKEVKKSVILEYDLETYAIIEPLVEQAKKEQRDLGLIFLEALKES